MKPVVRVVEFSDRYPMGNYMLRNGKFNLSKWVTDVTKNVGRNEKIARLLAAAVEKGRKVLLLSDRLEHLRVLEELLRQRLPNAHVDYYVGGRSEEELQRAEGAQVLMATFSMAAEGLDLPLLDCEFLTTPRSDVEQAVGRIQRSAEGKRTPVVVDFVDGSVSIARALAEKRRRTYARLGATFV
jgi:superfamily II DNA or RNA helicase